MEKMKNESCRNSSIELLRIIAIILIIFHHFNIHGIINKYTMLDTNSTQYMLSQMIGWGGYMCNSIFIIITGYFTIKKNINWYRIYLLIIELCFYSWIIAIIFYGMGLITFSIKDFIKYAFPLLYSVNWFVCCYIVLCCFLPYLNPYLCSLDKKKYLSLIIVIFILYSFIPSILKGITFMNDALSQFIFMYIVGGYIRRFPFSQKRFSLSKTWGMISLMLLIILFISIFLKGWILVNFISVFLSITFFMFFINLKPFYNNFINIISGTVLGVYLIHDNPLIRKWLWCDFYPNINYINMDNYIIFMITKVIIVFIICVVIDILRKILFEKILINNITKLYINLVILWKFIIRNFSKI